MKKEVVREWLRWEGTQEIRKQEVKEHYKQLEITD